VVLILKPDDIWRFCVDYRGLNEVTVRNVYPLPRISDILSRLLGAEFFSIVDLQSGYHQLTLRVEDRQKAAFVTPDGLYHFKVLPFGVANGPSTFQSTMDIVLGGLHWTSCLVYLDDIIIYAPTFASHLKRLNLVLSCLSKAGLKLKTSKCKFAMTTLKVLGHVVSREGIAPDPEKLRAVVEFPSCNEGKTQADKVKRVQRFLGLCSYYRKHTPGFSKIALPLILLTKKGQPFVWGDDQQNSFNQLKAALLAARLLAHPNYTLPMIIIPDACGFGIGAVLSQNVNGKEHPLAYVSRLLSSSEVNYSITEKECLALIWSLEKFRPLIWGCKLIIITDHEALCWLRTKRDLAGRLARWSLCLQEYDVEIQYRSGKLHQNADCLLRNPLLTKEKVLEERCLEVGSIIMDSLDLQLQDVRLEFAKKQREVREWRTIIERIEAKRSVGRHFCLLEHRLFKQKSIYGRNYLRLCVPPEFRGLILKSCHDDPVSGHLGIQ
jgi:hypothetical protein